MNTFINGPTPGEGVAATPADYAHQSEPSLLNLSGNILPEGIAPITTPFKSPIGSRPNPLEMFSIGVREYTILVRHPGCDEIVTETVLLDSYEVSLTEKEGFMGAFAILQLLSYVFGYELIHVREDYREFRLNLDQQALLHSRAFEWASKNTNNL